MSFYTVINCMDGRVQLPVIKYLMERFHVSYVDSITEPGPIRILAQELDKETIASILKKIRISFERHKSQGVAIVGHYDCAGNPVDKDQQIRQLRKAKSLLKQKLPGTEPLMLWVDEKWRVHQIR